MSTAHPHVPHLVHHRHLLESLLIALLTAAAVVVVIAAPWEDGSSPGATIGSGTLASQTRSVPEFSALSLAGANNVGVHVGTAQRVVIRGDDNLLSRVTTRVDHGTLVVGNKGSFRTTTPMRVDITAPLLTAASISGSGRMAIDGVLADRFSASLHGAGVMRISGSVDRLTVNLGGAGDMSLQELRARHATATIEGTGRIYVHATSTLEASVLGTGAIVYSGNPLHVTRSVSGAGTVTPG